MSRRNAIGAIVLALLLLTSSTPGLRARTLYLAPNGDDSAPFAAGSVFKTIFRALDSLAAGDTLIIRNGTYRGGLIVSPVGAAEAPILIRGESLAAVIDSSRNGYDALRLDHSAWVTVENVTFTHGKRAGLCLISCNHITVRGCRMADNDTWGILTGFVDDFIAEDNECYGSKIQHGIYHSNSGDRFVIRRNRIHDNAQCGIHLNGDPEMGGDGVLNWGVIEDNVIYRNGVSGGAAINMTHVHDFLVRNNLIYDNYAGGFTVYQDNGGFEQGSKRVVITGNTCVFKSGQGRNVVNIQTTSENVVVAGNILVCGGFVGSSQTGTLQIDTDYPKTIVTDYNIHWSPDTSQLVTVKGRFQSFSSWARSKGNGKHSWIANPLFVSRDSADYTLADSSPAIDAGMPLDSLRAILSALGGFDWIIGRLDSLPQEDIRGTWRPVGPAPDAGAYEMGMTEGQRLDFDGDRRIGRADARALLHMVITGGDLRCDLNGDGRISLLDVVSFLLQLGKN